MEIVMLPERLFLTVGSGFVGRNLIRHFTVRGVEVVALARSPASARESSRNLEPGRSRVMYSRPAWKEP